MVPGILPPLAVNWARLSCALPSSAQHGHADKSWEGNLKIQKLATSPLRVQHWRHPIPAEFRVMERGTYADVEVGGWGCKDDDGGEKKVTCFLASCGTTRLVQVAKSFKVRQILACPYPYKLTTPFGVMGWNMCPDVDNDKQQVAIKTSIKVDKHMKKEFTDEVIIQSAMRHKNIVMLLGCCLELDVPMLVYEFVARGSLYDVLFKCRDRILAGTRLRIAIGSAEGLTYMHSAGESTIRHGDVKSANILLDEKFTPKVSDFGTSKLLARGKAEMTEHVIGDMSYIDPVYMEQGIVT
ncbi:hypothetical protein CFC21_000153 [Triticum aestivum]|uniref:Protein kinase domain-containing protein n=2 Tax=Triticum TaxID=4564 RepID=A0A9R0PYA1_TRITD|nr:hypothetical protein CFC21_000153 [Triticum aestivum]VAH00343.1 unnamed protein product [Triticum turgidum subsp. durum]